MTILIVVVVIGIAGYWNHQTLKEFHHYRIRVNERLHRLEKAEEQKGTKLPPCSFGFFTDEDVYPGSNLNLS